MATISTIEWTEATWNPIAGCTIVSPGCTNCYAMRMAARLQAMGHDKYAGTTRKSGRRNLWTGRVNIDRSALEVPLKWRKPRRIFVNSMSDLFHESVPVSFIAEIWAIMEKTPWHTYQILSKRPERMADIIKSYALKKLPNVWLGTSVEDSQRKYRIKLLRNVPAFTRFISFEPLLGPIGNVSLRGINWVIVGGESGPNARPMRKEWVDGVRLTCESRGVPFFFKQWGGANKKATGRELDGQTWSQYPDSAPKAMEFLT